MKETLRDYIGRELIGLEEGTTVQDDEDLLGGGLVDSVGMMSLVMFVEERFDLRVPPEDVTIENFFSIETIDRYLRGRQER